MATLADANTSTTGGAGTSIYQATTATNSVGATAKQLGSTQPFTLH